MKLRKLELIGFKSFTDRTSIRFDDGITGVVGPNGCGKSNIVDAVRWVMGEQSARLLRGKNMEDVIFAGSETKHPMGMAEVRLTLENDGRNVPPEYAIYSEITVGRRLFRSGESEYLINRTPCRLLDVQELFMGTGVGTRAYSIIGQGNVGLLVTQKPIERRGLIEEAAGISKYNARKRVAERKMEQTQQNLLRINDIVQEIQRNINSLKRQARKAARYNRLREQMRDIDLHISSHRYLELLAVKKFLQQKLERFSSRETELHSLLARLESSIEQRRLHLLEDDHRISKTQEELLSSDNQVKLNEKNIEFLTREVDSLTEQGQFSASEIEALRAEVTKLSSEIDQAKQGLQELDEIATNAAFRLREREEELQAQNRRVEELSAQKENQYQEQLTCGEQTGELRTHLASLDQRLVELEGRLAQKEAEKNALQQRIQEASSKKHNQVERLNQLRQLHLNLIERREITENSLTELQILAKENEAKLFALREEIGHKRSRLQSLQEIEKNYEGCLSGVRQVMRKAQENQQSSQVVGLVADILQSPPRYETAVQAVLGDRLQSVVVRSQDAGLAAVDYLKKESEGRSSFIPLSLRDSETPADVGKVNGLGVIGPMRALLDYQKEYEKVIHYLLGDVVVVEDLPAAMTIWSANGHHATLVTLDGDVLEPQGVLTGGSLEGAGTHLLANKREIRELNEKLLNLEAEYRLVQDRQGKLNSQIAAVGSAIENLRQNSHDEEIKILDQQKDLNHLHEHLDGISKHLEKLGYEHTEVASLIDSCHREKERTQQGLSDLGKRQEEIENQVREVRNRADEEKQRLNGVSQDVLELKVQAVSSIERRESSRRSLEHMQKTRDELTQRMERLRNDLTSGNLKTVQGREQIDKNRQEISALLAQREKLQIELGIHREAYEHLFAEVRQDEMQIKEFRREQEQLSQEVATITTRLREIEMESGHLSKDVLRNQKVEIESILAAYHFLPPPTEEHHQQAEKIRQAIESMGDVNPHAEKEYEDLVQRYDFLTTQSRDLTESLDKLQKVIQKINRSSRRRFREAFDAINQKFMEVFPRLFSGGKAHLQIDESVDLLETGVDIIVQPPGKKLQNMELLSGGEKALTAIALLFAIFLIKPTPFCLLDEVDAPLDDANLDRFNAIIKEMSKTSQFVMITHNKRTMEAADQLYGITMEEPGVSKVVSVAFRDRQPELQQVG